MRRARSGGIAAAATLLLAVGIALLAAQPARAIVVNGCHASLNGTDITRLPVDEAHAIVVGKNDVVPMTMSGPGRKKFDNLHIALAFAGSSWNVYNASAGGGTWSHNIDVHSFAKYGVGLYEVHGVGDFVDGSKSCSGIAMVKVDGNPFSTVAGIAGAASAGVGILSVLGAGMAAGGGAGGGPYTAEDAKAEQARRLEDDEAVHEIEQSTGGWCFLMALALLPLLILFGTGALLMTVVAPAVRIRRRTWPAVVGPVGGLLTGLGAGVLLQEYAVVYPTRTWAIAYLAGGLAFGAIVPWLGRLRTRR